MANFHPAVAAWFSKRFGQPTQCQLESWPAIRLGQHTLIAAPTGSGKTLAAFLCAIDELIQLGLAGQLEEQTYVVYVSPLRALSNDVQRNLELPLQGIRDALLEAGLHDVPLRTLVRTGDTPAAARAMMRRRPPHILVTTPESLYLMLTSGGGRDILRNARTVIVDEVHALAGNKRGAHLSLSLERLAALAGRPLVRIGLSATQRPMEEIARFLTGTGGCVSAEAVVPPHPNPLPRDRGRGETIFEAAATAGEEKSFAAAAAGIEGRIFEAATAGGGEEIEGRGVVGGSPCTIVDLGHARARDLDMELPRSPLEAVMAGEVWNEIYDRLADLVRAHHTTLVFVNTRRMSERLARHLSERLGEGAVAAHHGSMAREQRFDAEQRLKAGKLPVMVATSSLELGIDIGDIDLVCQIGSTRSISAFLQRAGRAGHALDALPKARLFPTSRDELVEGIALLQATRRGELDALTVPQQPLDVLAQQIVAVVAMEEWDEEGLFNLLRRAWPYRQLDRGVFNSVVRMLADGIAARRGRAGAYLHRDAVNGRLRARRGARLTALTCGGAIPDNADYEVREEPGNTFVGTLNEDFAIESLAGDIFQLGNTSWRILRVETGTVRVEDARGQPPTMPFWLGEAPARSHELSSAVSRLRADLEREFSAGSDDLADLRERIARELAADAGVNVEAAQQAVDYLWQAYVALGCLPTQATVVAERFFDEAGGMQLVLHAPFGGRLNRAWGLALRKQFCRRFNFELQAAANEDAIVLSLGETHSFPLADIWKYLNAASVREVLTQALLDAPMFTTRWRWNANIALAVPRFRGGRKVPARLQRMQAEDLVAVVFPDQKACIENLAGCREIPQHPLVDQTLRDCLTEAMDIEALENLLRSLEQGSVRTVARDLTEPSPLAAEILSARPYTFLDDAPLEERRTQAVISRRWLDPQTAADLGRLDPQAIARVREETWPEVNDADELHDALLWLGFLSEIDIKAPPFAEQLEEWAARQQRWPQFLQELAQARRVTLIHTAAGAGLWVAAERLPLFQALYSQLRMAPIIEAPAEYRGEWTEESALIEILRGRLQGTGPATATSLAAPLSQTTTAVGIALAALEAEGFALRGRYTCINEEDEWCERRLLARIHAHTLQRLRGEIAPVSAASYLRFLAGWQHVGPGHQLEGEQALPVILDQLEGMALPAVAWERDVLPLRVRDYTPAMLDSLCLGGRYVWCRLALGGSAQAPMKTVPVGIVNRRAREFWRDVYADQQQPETDFDVNAERLRHYLQQHGPSFLDDLMEGTGLLPAQLREALAALTATGHASADGYSGVRFLITAPASKRRRAARHADSAGRWLLLSSPAPRPGTEWIERVVRTLLRRYGVLFRRLLEREPLLPPWRQLLPCLRRLEARGEIRGGRFVAGFSGEQFALPEAVGPLREAHRRTPGGELWSVCGADPLNMQGVLTPGARLPALASNRLLYRDGVPIATLQGRAMHFHESVSGGQLWQVKNALIRRPLMLH